MAYENNGNNTSNLEIERTELEIDSVLSDSDVSPKASSETFRSCDPCETSQVCNAKPSSRRDRTDSYEAKRRQREREHLKIYPHHCYNEHVVVVDDDANNKKYNPRNENSLAMDVYHFDLEKLIKNNGIKVAFWYADDGCKPEPVDVFDEMINGDFTGLLKQKHISRGFSKIYAFKSQNNVVFNPGETCMIQLGVRIDMGTCPHVYFVFFKENKINSLNVLKMVGIKTIMPGLDCKQEVQIAFENTGPNTIIVYKHQRIVAGMIQFVPAIDYTFKKLQEQEDRGNPCREIRRTRARPSGLATPIVRSAGSHGV